MEKINFVDFPSEDTPINAENLNKLQDNIENAINNYSEEEQVIGTWIDDKLLYRAVYSIEVTSASYNKDVSNLKIDTLTKIDGISQGNPKTMNYYSNSTDNLRVFITGDNKLYVSSGDTYPSKPFKVVVILEYTKTTD